MENNLENRQNGRVIDMSKRINRELKTSTRIGQNIAKLHGEKKYVTADGSLTIIVPVYGLKGSEEDKIDAVELNYHLVSSMIQQAGDFKDYVNSRKRNNPLVQKVNDYTNGNLDVPDIKTALLTHLMPAYTNKEHIINVELFPDDNNNSKVDWEEITFGRTLNLSSSVIDQNLIMPLIGKFNLFGDSTAGNANVSNHLKLG